MPKPKFTREEKHMINTPIIEYTEDEKLIRKQLINRIQNYEEKKTFFNKKKQIIKEKLEYARNMLSSKNITDNIKEHTCRHMGLYLVNNGKEKLGLQYLNEALSYREKIYGPNHPSTLDQYGKFNLLSKRANITYKNRMINKEKLKQQKD